MGDFGMQTSFNFLKFYSSQTRNFSVGAVVKNLGVSTLTDETLPQMVTTGIAWSPLRPWTMAVDCNIPFTFPFQYVPGSHRQGLPRRERGRGHERQRDGFPLRAGWGALEGGQPPDEHWARALDMGTMDLVVNYNLDLSGQLNPLDKFSVQARFNLGDSGSRGPRQRRPKRCICRGWRSTPTAITKRPSTLWEQVLQDGPQVPAGGRQHPDGATRPWPCRIRCADGSAK